MARDKSLLICMFYNVGFIIMDRSLVMGMGFVFCETTLLSSQVFIQSFQSGLKDSFQ